MSVIGTFRNVSSLAGSCSTSDLPPSPGGRSAEAGSEAGGGGAVPHVAILEDGRLGVVFTRTEIREQQVHNDNDL